MDFTGCRPAPGSEEKPVRCKETDSAGGSVIRHQMARGSSHNPEVAGSNPAPATEKALPRKAFSVSQLTRQAGKRSSSAPKGSVPRVPAPRIAVIYTAT